MTLLRTTQYLRVVAGIDGAALKKAREMDGASRTQLAERAGISVQYLCDIEEGRRTLKRNPGLVNRLAEACGVPKSWLQKRAVEEEPTEPAPKPTSVAAKARAAKAAAK